MTYYTMISNIVVVVLVDFRHIRVFERDVNLPMSAVMHLLGYLISVVTFWMWHQYGSMMRLFFAGLVDFVNKSLYQHLLVSLILS